LHCLGQLAAAGTVEAFQPYLQTATQVANHFLSTEILELREAAFAFYYLLARVLEGNIAPYSEFVLNQAMISASNIDKAPVTIVDEEDEDDSDVEEEERSVRTVFLDEKTAALHAIGNLLF